MVLEFVVEVEVHLCLIPKLFASFAYLRVGYGPGSGLRGLWAGSGLRGLPSHPSLEGQGYEGCGAQEGYEGCYAAYAGHEGCVMMAI